MNNCQNVSNVYKIVFPPSLRLSIRLFSDRAIVFGKRFENSYLYGDGLGSTQGECASTKYLSFVLFFLLRFQCSRPSKFLICLGCRKEMGHSVGICVRYSIGINWYMCEIFSRTPVLGENSEIPYLIIFIENTAHELFLFWKSCSLKDQSIRIDFSLILIV